MLINARNPAELRVALVSDKTLDDLKVDVAERGLTRGNIYYGVISNVQPSLNAAFIDYGAERNGFLTIQDVVPEAYHKKYTKKSRPKIEEVLEDRKSLLVQVSREPEGQKGSALTTNLSLAGRYLVLTPYDSTRGVSRKVDSDETRRALKKLATSLDVPDGAGVIVRTNALDQNKTTLNRDLNALLRLWKRISTEAERNGQVRLLYSDQDIVLQALRDYLDTSVQEVLVDEVNAFNKAQEYIRAFMPRSRVQLTFYEDRAPLFARYDLESQIDRIFQRTAPLPSGGSIVIDRTEALTAIDVNSGRSTRASSQEETAVNTNLEAAAEVARQLRLRDIGGLVVVDFIDMRARKNQRRVERALIDALKPDKARATVGRTSSNGLVEVNRQRIHQAIQVRTQRVCPNCAGTGRVPSPDIVSLHILRELQARCQDGSIERVRIRLHPELADAFQNMRRTELATIEKELDVRIEILSSMKLGPTERDIDWYARAALRRGPVVRTAAEAAVANISEAADDARSSRSRPAKKSKTTKKRKTRKRRTDAKSKNEGTEATKAKGSDGEDNEDEEAPRRRTRRRRLRGGRSRSRRSKSDETPTDDDAIEAAADDVAEGGDGETDRDGDEKPARRRRRSRGGRGRGRRASESGDPGDSDDGAATSDASPSANGDEKERPARRRRTRGGRGRGRRVAASDAEESSATSGDDKRAEADSDGPEKPARSRRKTRRTRAGASDTSEKSGAETGAIEAPPRAAASTDSGAGRSWARAEPPPEDQS